MQKEFSLSNGKAMVNFTSKYCDSEEAVLNSYAFRTVLTLYMKKISKRETNVYRYIQNCNGNQNEEETINNVINIFKLLLVFKSEEVSIININYKKLLNNKDNFVQFIEGLYNFWRKIERYTIVQNNKVADGLQNVSFIDANAEFSKLILSTYRKIEENAVGSKPKIYRQLPAGGNAGLILNNLNWPYPDDYKSLYNIPFVESVVLNSPFIIYPKKNKRDGMFTEVKTNPINDCTINPDHWFCYPAKVGTLLAYIYFHRDFIAHGVTLCNLFEIADENECKGKKPDIVFIFGARDKSNEKRTVYYDDKQNGIMLGYVSYDESIDYFGYMKKMALTLHNLIMIKNGYIPIHGAMANIVTKEGKTSNIVIMGDSGAGKSESIEALRELSEDYISDLNIIFDDMGVIKLDENNMPYAYGTEIGAFVRLDDLDTGYAFRQIDRSIFMNPDKINARLVIPIADYKQIISGYKVDMLLYANNYEEGEELSFFDTPDDAAEVFKAGTRMAKGTTTEMGLVKTYFANPFGPVQKKEEMDKLIPVYFDKFFKAGVKVGQLRTNLGIKGKEKDGPRKAALKLLEQIKAL